MKSLVILTSILVVTAVVAVGIGVVDVNNLINNPAEEFGNIGSNIRELFSGPITPDDPSGNTTPPSDTGASDSTPPTGSDDTTSGGSGAAGRPWETVSCDIDPLPEAPGYEERVVGWTLWDYPVNEEKPYENYKLVVDGWDIFALGNEGGLMRLDDGFWTRVETNNTHGLSYMMTGTWPSYIVGACGTVLSYSPVTGTVKTMETPWDGLDEYDRPSLYAAWGSNHENFWVLGDGVMYHYAKLPSSHPNYNASDQTPKWQWEEAPVLPWNMRGPYDKRIQDVWVNDYDSVFALINTPGFGYSVTEWDGHEWGDAKEIPTTSLIRSIWGFSHDNIFAVGVAATVMHYDGVEWSEWENLGLDMWNSYSAIWGTSMTNLFCVGDGATTSSQLMHWDGQYWSGQEVPIDSGLSTVVGWGEATTSVYISGSHGVILRYLNPAEEDAVDSRDQRGLSEVYGLFLRDSASDEGYTYMCGGDEDGLPFLVRYSPSSGLQSVPLDMGGKSVVMYGVTVKDGLVYSSGRTWDEIVIVKHSFATGQTSYMWDKVEGGNWRTDKIAVSEDGSIYIAGVSDVSMGDQEYSGFSSPPDDSIGYTPFAFDSYLIKYSQQGERQWFKMWGNPDEPMPSYNDKGEEVSGLEIDSLGRIIVVGNTGSPEPFTVDSPSGELELSLINLGDEALKAGYWYVNVFNDDGEALVSNGWGAPSSYHRMASSSLSDEGELYLVGYSSYAGKIDDQWGTRNGDQLIMKLDSQFDPVWIRYIAGEGHQYIQDSVIGNEGDLYVTGTNWGVIGGLNNFGFSDVFVSRIQSDGLLLGTKVLGGVDSDVGRLIGLDSSGNPVVWFSTYSPSLLDDSLVSGFMMWDVGYMEIDVYAECRIPYRDN